MTKKTGSDLGLNARLYSLPNRHEIIRNLDQNTRSPLSSMQLWSIDDCPVVIQKDGSGKILLNDEWREFDTWELISEGIPFSFLMFEERWPGIVDCRRYLSSFDD